MPRFRIYSRLPQYRSFLLPALLPSLKDKAAKGQTAQSSGMALLKVGVIAVHGGKRVCGGDFAGGIERHAFIKTPSELSLYLGPQSSYHLPGVAQPEIESQKIHPVPNGENLGFGIKAELKTRLQKSGQSILQTPEEVPVLMDKHAVIHVAEVMLYLKLFLYQSVKGVQIVHAEPLTGLVPHGKPLAGGGLVAVNNAVQKREQPFISGNPSELVLQDLMIHGIEVLSDIAPQKIALIPVMTVMIRQKTRKPFESEGKPLTRSTGRIVIDETLFQHRPQKLIAETVLHYPIPVMQRGDVSLFGLVNIEVIVSGHPVAAVPDGTGQGSQIHGQVLFKKNDFSFVTLGEPCLAVGPVQVLKIPKPVKGKRLRRRR